MIIKPTVTDLLKIVDDTAEQLKDDAALDDLISSDDFIESVAGGEAYDNMK